MGKIFAIVKRDIVFNKKMLGIMLCSLLLLMVLAAAGVDGSDATETLNYLVYTCCASIIVVPFSYNLEDNLETRRFLSTLPICIDEIIIAKHCLNFFISALISIAGILVFGIFGKPVMLRCIIIPIMGSCIMSSSFMFSFYKWDMNIARLVAISPIVLFAVVANRIEEISLDGSFIGIENLIVIVFVSGLIAFVLGKLTVRIGNIGGV